MTWAEAITEAEKQIESLEAQVKDLKKSVAAYKRAEKANIAFPNGKSEQ